MTSLHIAILGLASLPLLLFAAYRRRRHIQHLYLRQKSREKELHEAKLAARERLKAPIPIDPFVATFSRYDWRNTNTDGLSLVMLLDSDGKQIGCETTSWDAIHAILGSAQGSKLHCTAEKRPRWSGARTKIIEPIFVTDVVVEAPSEAATATQRP
jgi:hypothetical protein